MSTGGTGGHPLYGMSGASAVQQSVDMADSLDKKDFETTAKQESSVPKHHEQEDKSFLTSFKEALKPGDTKRRASASEATQEGGKGGIMESMKPSRRDDSGHQKQHERGGIMKVLKPNSTEGEKHRDATSSDGGLLQSMMPGHKEHINKESRSNTVLDVLRPGDSHSEDVQESHQRRGSMLDSLNPGDSTPNMPNAFQTSATGSDPGTVGQQRRKSHSNASDFGNNIREKLGLGDRSERNYQYDVFPGTERHEGPGSKGEYRRLGDIGATPRNSVVDTEGTIGRHFTSEGNIGGTADKVGGPFSKEGAVGRQFEDTGAVGGTIQDTLGHGDATRKGK
ncbi:hypothetical protein F4810DRAFT_181371 [Camillea tinctor]|nr:hypothetical protein F4810DRAFT_181371 [Camillea tinctor]